MTCRCCGRSEAQVHIVEIRTNSVVVNLHERLCAECRDHALRAFRRAITPRGMAAA